MKTCRRGTAITGAAAWLSAGVLLLSGCGAPGEDDFPSGPIEIIVPWEAGGSSDAQVRAFAEPFEEEIGVTVNVVNRPGGGTAIGTTEAAQAEADGYTLVHATATSFATTPLLEDVAYSIDDFQNVASLTDQPTVLVINPDSEWESIEDVAEADGPLTFGVTAVGNITSHLTVSNFLDQEGIEGEAIPFDSATDTAQAVVNGDADLSAVDLNAAIPQIEGDSVQPIAVSTDERLEGLLSDVPTYAEAGYESSSGTLSRAAVVAPADTPDDVLDALREAGENAVQDEVFVDYRESNYMLEPEYRGDDFFDEYMSESIDWAEDSFDRAGLETVE